MANRGYEPTPTVKPEAIKVPMQNEKVPAEVSNPGWTEAEVRGRGAEPAKPRP